MSSSATAAVVLAALAAGAGAVGVVGACLPELDPLNAPDDAAAVPPSQGANIGQFCGDGLISLLDDGGYAGESCDPGDGGAIDDGSTSGCRACKLVCPGGVLHAGSDHCYFLRGSTGSYSDAFDACKDAGGHVVTLASEDEQAIASAIVDDAGGGTFWVGLEISPRANGYETPVEEPGYPAPGEACRGCFGSPDGGALPLFPGQDSGLAECVVSVSGPDGGWFGTRCDRVGAFQTLCEREPPGQRRYACGGALCTTVPITFGSKRYVFVPTPVPADQAAQDCIASFKGRLVLLDSPEEREELMREIQLILNSSGPGGQPTVWIGLGRDAGSGEWVWDDQDGGRLFPWGNNEPAPNSGDRAYLRVSDRYDTELAASDDVPGTLRYELCERPAVPDGGP